jgi:peptidoglycan/xylan/chitin deacetylase (PgdA/CDA1 family)
MLNLRTANVYLVSFAAVAILLMIFNPQYWWLLLILAIFYIYLLVAGSIKICSGFYMDVLCKGITEEKIVALTFDDGPNEKHTHQILDILEKQQVQATFFVIGHKASDQQELLRCIVSNGHALGNHSFGHAFFFDLYRRKKMEQDLQKDNELIEKLTGKKTAFFRPPYGVTNPVLAKVVKKLGFKAVGWSIRSLDTVLKDEEKIVERITDRLHPGAIILMHDNREMTVKVLEKVILAVKKEGYRFVRIEDLIK